MLAVSIDEIYEARARVASVVTETPVLPTFGLDVPHDNQLWLKAENLQRTSSFKIRGAYNALSLLSPGARDAGVITYSSGNHGQAVACAAYLLGARAVVVMPEDSIAVKVESTRAWGAEIEFAGHTSLDRQERATQLAERNGYAIIPPFDDARIIAGQGTAGLEIIEQLPTVEAICIPVGGGGLIAGIAIAVKAARPDVRIIGVEPEGGADARSSLRTGEIVTWDGVHTVADGLRTSRVGNLNFATIQELVDDIVTVPDDEILWTVRILALDGKLVVEPSGAAASAAVLFGHTQLTEQRIVSVVSGGNIEQAALSACINMTAHPSDKRLLT